MREIKELCILSCFRLGTFSIAGKPVTAAPVTLFYREVTNVRRSSDSARQESTGVERVLDLIERPWR